MASPYKKFLPRKVDVNQPEVVSTFRKLGCTVRCLHMVGDGVFDLIVAIDFLNILVEIKDGNKCPSERVLTPDQKKFNFEWQGLRAVVTGNYEARMLVSEARALVALFRNAAIVSGTTIAVSGSRERMYQPALF